MQRRKLVLAVIAAVILTAGGITLYLSRRTPPPTPSPRPAPHIVSIISSADAEEAWVRGNKAMEAQDFDRAAADYDEALGRDPKFALALAGRGNAMLSLQRYDDALADYSAAIEQQPDLPEAYLGRGTTNWLLGRLPEAGEDFRKLTELYPDNSFYATRLADILVEARRYDEAEQIFHAAYDRNPDNQWALGLWLSAMLARSPEAVIEKGTELSEAGVTAPGLYDAVGNAFLIRKSPDYDNAIHWLEPLLKADPSQVSPNSIQNLALAYAHSGKMAECQSTMRDWAARMGRGNELGSQFCEENAQ